MSTNAADRLAEKVRARRVDELDLNQLDVARAGGPSNTLQTQIENGRLEKLTRATARKLDDGLRWERGSARRVWNGEGDAVPLPEGVRNSREAALLRKHIGEADVAASLRERLLRAFDSAADEEAAVEAARAVTPERVDLELGDESA